MPISPRHKTPSYQRLFHESRRRLFDDPTGSLSVRTIHGFENRKWQQQNLMSGISKNERSERLFESVKTRFKKIITTLYNTGIDSIRVSALP